MIAEDKIIVALDTSDEAHLMKILTALEGHKVWVKIGMELFYSLGPKSIELSKERGFKVFLDLKLHDIPTTVTNGMLALARHKVDMLNMHAAGGFEMMKQTVERVKGLVDPPLLIAVTQLTSTSQEQMNKEQLIQGELLESVINYAHMAKMSGCQGVVSSPHEVQEIKKVCGENFLAVTPGIRPLGTDVNDQKRITTPGDAIRLGVDYMVIGRPITQASNPKVALINILKGN